MAIAKQSVEIRQRKAEMLVFRVDGTGTAEIEEGTHHATLTDNGTGDYTLTLRRAAARRDLVVLGAVSETAGLIPQVVAKSATAVQIKWIDASDTATDNVFTVALLAFDSPTQH